MKDEAKDELLFFTDIRNALVTIDHNTTMMIIFLISCS